jgi:DNA invertase Pin-like site-specific DNA recombinase
MPHHTIAYLRTSTIDQDIEKNKAAMVALATSKQLGTVRFVEETVSGKVSWRDRTIAAILDTAEKGDALLVMELSRIGRTMLECMEMLSFALSKGINIYAVKGDRQLTNSSQRESIVLAFSMAAEIEQDFIALQRALISKRTREAVQVLKQNGVKLGGPRGIRKSMLDAHKGEIEALLQKGISKKVIAKQLGTSQTNLYNWIKLHVTEVKH